MAETTDPATMSVRIPDDVYKEDFEFRETAYMATDELQYDSSDTMYESAAQIIIEAVGQDPVKLFALVDVVHDRIVTERMWAIDAAIKFYK